MFTVRYVRPACALRSYVRWRLHIGFAGDGGIGRAKALARRSLRSRRGTSFPGRASLSRLKNRHPCLLTLAHFPTRDVYRAVFERDSNDNRRQTMIRLQRPSLDFFVPPRVLPLSSRRLRCRRDDGALSRFRRFSVRRVDRPRCVSLRSPSVSRASFTFIFGDRSIDQFYLGVTSRTYLSCGTVGRGKVSSV